MLKSNYNNKNSRCRLSRLFLFTNIYSIVLSIHFSL